MSRLSARSTSAMRSGSGARTCSRSRRVSRGQRAQPRVPGLRVLGRVAEVVERLDQRPGLRRQVGDRLRQRVGGRRRGAGRIVPGVGAEAPADRGRPGSSGSSESLGVGRAAGQVAGAAAECHQVARADPPPRPGQQAGERVRGGGVVQHAQGRHHVLHFRHRQQAAEPDHLARDAARFERPAQRHELRPFPAQHGDVRRAYPGEPAVWPQLAVRRDPRGQREQRGRLGGYPLRLFGHRRQQRRAHVAPAAPVGRRLRARGTSGACARSSACSTAAASSTRPALRKLVESFWTGAGVARPASGSHARTGAGCPRSRRASRRSTGTGRRPR